MHFVQCILFEIYSTWKSNCIFVGSFLFSVYYLSIFRFPSARSFACTPISAVRFLLQHFPTHFCMRIANSLYLCTLKIRFSFWKMEKVHSFFFVHSNELSLCGCNVLFTSIGFDCDINVFRTAAADDDAVTSWCGGATQSMHWFSYLSIANCNIIFTKKYCIKSNEWNKCQSAHTWIASELFFQIQRQTMKIASILWKFFLRISLFNVRRHNATEKNR